jgi:murein L,D-transpeptidase YafK
MARRSAWLARLAAAALVATASGSDAMSTKAAPTLPPGARVDRLVASKSAHELEAWSGDERLATYRIAVGAGGEGPKRFEGDRRTPEGVYRIDRRHRSARFHRFLHISYPNDDDRRRYDELRRNGEVPEGKGIGGDIGLHGESKEKLVRPLGRHVDWTQGCISVSDAEIEQLYRVVVPDAVLEIRP